MAPLLIIQVDPVDEVYNILASRVFQEFIVNVIDTVMTHYSSTNPTQSNPRHN